MVTEAGATPVTTPLPLTVAKDVLLLLQLPPETPSNKDDAAPGQTVVVPVIVPAFGKGLMVTDAVATAVPQLFVNE